MALRVKNGEVVNADSRFKADLCSGNGAVHTKMKGYKLLEDRR